MRASVSPIFAPASVVIGEVLTMSMREIVPLSTIMSGPSGQSLIRMKSHSSIAGRRTSVFPVAAFAWSSVIPAAIGPIPRGFTFHSRGAAAGCDESWRGSIAGTAADSDESGPALVARALSVEGASPRVHAVITASAINLEILTLRPVSEVK